MAFNCITSEQMALLVEGDISSSEKIRLLKHVVQCDTCYEEYLTLLEMKDIEDRESFEETRKVVSPDNINNAGLTDFPFVIEHDFTAGQHHEPLAASSAGSQHLHDHEHGNNDHHDHGSDGRHLKIEHAVNSFGEHGSAHNSGEVQQNYADTCAIKAQQLILHDFGIHVTEEQLRQEAADKGWYIASSGGHDGGTYMQDVGKLLESHGVEVHQNFGGNVYSIVNELAQGHEVIVDVDAGALWHPGFMEKIKDAFVGDTPNHALIVAGINTVNPNDVRVFLKDPGTGDIAKEYTLGHFMDAWKDSHCFMVSTNEPVPNMKNFDYSKGHIDKVDDFSYHDFHQLHTADLEVQNLAAGQFHDTGNSILDFTQNHLFIQKIVDFFEDHLHHHQPDNTEVNNHDNDHSDPGYDGSNEMEGQDH